VAGGQYSYTDGDARPYASKYPLQIHGFDPNFPLVRPDLHP